MSYTLVRRASQHNNQLQRTETYSVKKYFYSIWNEYKGNYSCRISYKYSM